MHNIERDWQLASDLYFSKALVNARVSGLNPGGVLIRFRSLTGFVPRTQLSRDHQIVFDEGTLPAEYGSSSLGRWAGVTLQVRVVEVDREHGRIILSERAAMAKTDVAQSD